MTRIAVKIMPKKEVLDTQGRAVLEVLQRETGAVTGCQVGKMILLEMEGENVQACLDQAKAWAESLLSNPLIEDFELSVL